MWLKGSIYPRVQIWLARNSTIVMIVHIQTLFIDLFDFIYYLYFGTCVYMYVLLSHFVVMYVDDENKCYHVTLSK